MEQSDKMYGILSLNPMDQFRHWLEEATRASGDIYRSHTMVLATVDRNGEPAVRIVLMKTYDEEGFTFATSGVSPKAAQLDENPNCSLLFHWSALMRSVRIKGVATKMSSEESATIFEKRSRPSQIAVSCVRQSEVLPTMMVYQRRFDELHSKYGDSGKIPIPESWMSYRVRPTSIEFWQGSHARRDDYRVRFRLPSCAEDNVDIATHEAMNGWVYEYLGM